MDDLCSFSEVSASIACGECREVSEIVILSSCTVDIKAHLASCHLSKSGLKEYEVILAIAGFFQFDEMVQQKYICPNHRYKLGRYWRPRVSY